MVIKYSPTQKQQIQNIIQYIKIKLISKGFIYKKTQNLKQIINPTKQTYAPPPPRHDLLKYTNSEK